MPHQLNAVCQCVNVVPEEDGSRFRHPEHLEINTTWNGVLLESPNGETTTKTTYIYVHCKDKYGLTNFIALHYFTGSEIILNILGLHANIFPIGRY